MEGFIIVTLPVFKWDEDKKAFKWGWLAVGQQNWKLGKSLYFTGNCKNIYGISNLKLIKLANILQTLHQNSFFSKSSGKKFQRDTKWCEKTKWAINKMVTAIKKRTKLSLSLLLLIQCFNPHTSRSKWPWTQSSMLPTGQHASWTAM